MTTCAPPRHRLAAGRRAASEPRDRAVRAALCLAVLPLALAACTPTVKVEAPKEPITINLNVQADVRVTLEEAAKKDIAANPGVF